MATGKITKRTLDALQAGSVEGFLWDQDLRGFGLRITAGGAASYVVQYRMGGREAKTRRYTIGGHGSPWTPSTAREEAGQLLRLVAQGIDPVESDKQRRREAVDLAFSAYADRFAGACKGKGWKALVVRILKMHVKPVLRDKALPTITRVDIVAVLDRMPEEQAANRRNAFAVMRRLFRWAISRGDIAATPMEGMETPPAVKARERWLTDAELKRVWLQAPNCHRCFGPIVRLLIATGQRREEITGLDWSELGREERDMRLSGDRTKNGEPTNVPLNDLAVAELDRVAGTTTWPKRGLVFKTSTGARFTAHAKGKRTIDKLIADEDDGAIPPWRLHDLRRTLATGFQRIIAIRTARQSRTDLLEPGDAGEASLADQTALQFESIAAEAPNREIGLAIASAADRLHPFRLIEPRILEPLIGELDELLIFDAGQPQAVRRYHLRRMKAAPALLALRNAL